MAPCLRSADHTRIQIFLSDIHFSSISCFPASRSVVNARALPSKELQEGRGGAGDFKKNFGALLKEAVLGMAFGKPAEIWFPDEARVGQKGTHAYLWAPVESHPAMVRDNRHDTAYIFGAICPACRTGAALITQVANADWMNEHLAEISTQVARRGGWLPARDSRSSWWGRLQQ